MDDLKLANCEYQKPSGQFCSTNDFTCRSGHCILKSAICDLNNDCCDSSDEREDLCAGYFRFLDDAISYYFLNIFLKNFFKLKQKTKKMPV